MDFKYYTEVPTSSMVWYKLITSDGKLIRDYKAEPCFGEISHGFAEDADQIQVYHDRNKIPYNVDCIKRWIADLNEMGFPCFFEQDDDPNVINQIKFVQETCAAGLEDTALMLLRHGEELPAKPHNFFVNVYDYEDKNHLFSTLFLIRCLTETGVNRVPEEYFKLMDADPNRDKFEACQKAHWIVSRYGYDPRCYANKDHMVTSEDSGAMITKTALMERFATKKVPIRDKGYLRVTANWDASNDNGWRGKPNTYWES